MKQYRVDYLLKNGERGVWHCEHEAADHEEVAAECRTEYDHIAKRLKRETDEVLASLIVVEITETDVQRVVKWR